MRVTQPYEYDIAIAGGGLAGLALAVQCAGAGYATVLFEKEQYPFHKVCGEYISMESWGFLQQCGLLLDDWLLPCINQLQLSDCAGKTYQFALPQGGFGISRYLLDHALSQQAQQKGAVLLTGCRVNDVIYKDRDDHFILQTAKQEYTAKIVAGCFGKRSNLDIKWNRSFVRTKNGKLDNYVGVKYHIRYPQPAGMISLHNFAGGYCGISQVEDDTCCLCYLTTAANLRRSGNSIARMEAQVLSQNLQLKKIFAGAEQLYQEPLAIAQVSFTKKQQVENHILMLGDAAGMIAPLCGNGMSMALHASKMAFDCAGLFLSGAIDRSSMEKRYRDQWLQQFGRRTAAGRMIQRYFGNRYATALFLQTMHRLPRLAQWVIAQTHGNPF